MATGVQHEPQKRRFVSQLPEGEAELTYVEAPRGVLDLQHTFVPEPARGRGAGEALVQAAFDHARANDARIVPTCPFVRAWVGRHPEASALVATR